MKRLAMSVLAAATLAGTIGFGAAPARAELISLTDINQPIVPTILYAGDREFGGNGPLMVVGVELAIGRGGRAIFANVSFSARETGGDGSHTAIGPVSFLVWKWKPSDGANFVHRINSPTRSILRHVSAPGCTFGCGFIGEAEDGGLIVTVPVTTGGPVRDIRLLGDTAGDDISTDTNPHGDTSIRRIRFNRIDVTFGPTLLRR